MFEAAKAKDVPWDELNDLAQQLAGQSQWTAWDFIKRHPEYEWEETRDKILVPLSNNDKITRSIPLETRIIMVLWMVRDCLKEEKAGSIEVDAQTLKEQGFKYWWEHGKVRIYRGVPEGGAHEPKAFSSYTLMKNYAVKFCNPAWVAGVFMPRKEDANGTVQECILTPKDIHIYNDAGYEKEVIPRVVPALVKEYRVEKGEIQE